MVTTHACLSLSINQQAMAMQLWSIYKLCDYLSLVHISKLATSFVDIGSGLLSLNSQHQ